MVGGKNWFCSILDRKFIECMIEYNLEGIQNVVFNRKMGEIQKGKGKI